MATLAHDVCDVHGASTLYIKHVGKVYTGFSLLGWGSPTTNQKFAHSPPPHQIFIPFDQNIIFSCSHCSCTIFCLSSYSFETQVMLILILIDVQYSQNAVFSYEKFSNRQNHSSSGSHHLVKKSPQQCSLLFDTKSEKLLKF